MFQILRLGEFQCGPKHCNVSVILVSSKMGPRCIPFIKSWRAPKWAQVKYCFIDWISWWAPTKQGRPLTKDWREAGGISSLFQMFCRRSRELQMGSELGKAIVGLYHYSCHNTPSSRVFYTCVICWGWSSYLRSSGTFDILQLALEKQRLEGISTEGLNFWGIPRSTVSSYWAGTLARKLAHPETKKLAHPETKN